MRNPFKKNSVHEEEHDELFDIIQDFSTTIHLLTLMVKELREEVDYLVDELDD